FSGWACRLFFFFSSRRRHTRFSRDWSSDVCSSDLCAAASGCTSPQSLSRTYCRAAIRDRTNATASGFTSYLAMPQHRTGGRAARRHRTARASPRPAYPGRVTDVPVPKRVSEIFDPQRRRDVEGFDLTDITYHRGVERGPDGVRDLPVVRVAFDRPEVRNAFRPHTVDELYRVLDHARMSSDVACVLLTGNGPSPKDGGWAFCSGGDQRIRGRDGYRYSVEGGGETADAIDPPRAGRLHDLEVPRLMRTMPKPIIAVVPGWAAGGGHSLHVVADLTIASREHARFMQTDANVGSFDAGYGSGLLARQVGDKRAREIFFLAREYSAEQ